MRPAQGRLFLDDGDVRLWHGDALDVLRDMPSESVDCVVTSPPYWGLRDYGNDGQLGLEETPDLFVAAMVDVFREVRRVLAPHGTVWCNLGDSYHNADKWGGGGANTGKHTRTPDGDVASWQAVRRRWSTVEGLKPKDLVGIPWRVAFALQADGWWLRSDIVWAKPNPMPESVTDRPTKAHEYVFLLTKQPRYWFDAEAVREAFIEPERAASRYAEGFRAEKYGSRYVAQGVAPDNSNHRSPTLDGSDGEAPRGPDGRRNTHVEASDGSLQHRDGERWPNPTGRNVRSVWTIATQPYPEAHFATYPEELVRRCVLAGCPERVCRTCGKASGRLTEAVEPETRPLSSRTGIAHVPGNVPLKDGSVGASRFRAVGWSDCGHNNWRPGTVLDPFIGSGTTCKVARDHGRHSVGIDLNADYLHLAAKRLQQLSLLSEPALSPTTGAV